MVFGLAFGSVECSYFSIKVHYFLCLTNTSLTGCHSIFFFYSNANTNFSKEGIKTLPFSNNFLLFGQKKNISSTNNRKNILSSNLVSNWVHFWCFFKMINFFSSEFQLESESLRHNPPMETQQKVPISGFIVKAFRSQREKLTVIASSFQLENSCLKVKTINLQTANLVEGKTYLSLRHLWEKQSFQCHLGDFFFTRRQVFI